MDLEDQYVILGELSNGVMKARSKSDQKEVAIREITLGNMTAK